MQKEITQSITRLNERSHDLETRYTHLQHTVEQLNEVVVEQAKKIDSLERKLAVLVRQFSSLADRDVEPRSLEDDKPPHY